MLLLFFIVDCFVASLLAMTTKVLAMTTKLLAMTTIEFISKNNKIMFYFYKYRFIMIVYG